MVSSAMLYGLETAPLTKSQVGVVETVELKFLRFSTGITRIDEISKKCIKGAAHLHRIKGK